jgi:hypothetical protein
MAGGKNRPVISSEGLMYFMNALRDFLDMDPIYEGPIRKKHPPPYREPFLSGQVHVEGGTMKSRLINQG